MKLYLSLRTIITFLLFILLSSQFSIFNSQLVYASSSGLSISPPIFEVVLQPVETISQTFTIQNLSSSDTTVTARIVPFVPEGDAGLTSLKPNLRPDWLKIFSLSNSSISLNKPFVIPNGKTERLILTITTPDDLDLADYYATLIVTTNNATISTTIGANILLSVSNTKTTSTIVRILDFVPSGNDFLFHYGNTFIIDNSLPIHFLASAKNVGASFTKTNGQVRISMGKKPIYTQDLIPLNLLSESNRLLTASPSGQIVFKPSFTHIGLFRAQIDIGNQNGSSHSEINLLLLPIKLSFQIAIVAAIVLILIRIKKVIH